MSDGIVANTEGFVEAHPYATAGIGVGVILLIWYLSSGSKPAQTTAAPDQTAGYAAQLGAAQIAASAQTTQASIAAGVQNQASSDALSAAITQMNDALAAAISGNQTTATIANAQRDASIASSNSNTAIAGYTSNAAVAISGNQTLADEFKSLAGLLSGYATTANNNAAATSQAGIAGNTSIATTFLNDFYNSPLNMSTWGPQLWAGTTISSNGSVIGAGTSQEGAILTGQNPGIAGQGGAGSGENTAVNALANLSSQIGNGVQFHAG